MRVTVIPIQQLALTLIPVLVVLYFYVRWDAGWKTIIYSVLRMITQLILVGYALGLIFKQENPLITSGILILMLIIASWISLRPLVKPGFKDLLTALYALIIGAVPVLALVVFGVVRLEPWYKPNFIIPLAGMIFANSMNAVSLCAERLNSELTKSTPFVEARRTAYRASLLPLINSLFAVGLVSLPGMMTGQILAGISPLIAVRYQIMVMLMLLGAAGTSSALYIIFKWRKQT